MKKKITALIIIGFVLYFCSFFNGFVWDDEVFLQNPNATQDAGAMASQTYFRPVMTALYNVYYAVFGGQPFFYHLLQSLFHICTAILILYLFRRFFKENLAFFISLLFLVHPANVEAVCFASATQEVLFTCTGLLGLFLLVRSKTISVIALIISLTLATAALLMKETGVVFFALLFLYLALFERKKTQILGLFIAFSTVLLFSYGMVRVMSGNTYVQSEGLFPIMRVPLAIRLINIPQIILYYLSLFIFPLKLGIAQHWVVRSVGFANFFLPLILEIILFSAGIFYYIKTKNKVFLFFFLWFCIGLLPHLQIVPLNMTVAERWLYFSQIGLLGMLAVALSHIKKYNTAIIFIGVCVIIIFSSRSFFRILDWRDGLTLYGSNIAKDSSFDLQNNMGVELFRSGKVEAAKGYFEKSTELAPYWWVNWNNLGAVYEHEKNYQKAAEYYKKSIHNGYYQLAYENLGKILVGRGNDKKQASDFVQKSLQLFPESQTLQELQKYIQQQK